MDDAFDALANEYRRELLVDLMGDTPQPVPELSDVSWELAESDAELLRRHLSSRREISDADEEHLRVHHVHLPKLADYGFVRWNRDDNVVSRGPRFDSILPLLEFLADGRPDHYVEVADDESPPRVVDRDLQ